MTHRRKAIGKTKNEMGQPRETLGIGVAQQEEERAGHELQSQWVQLPCSTSEHDHRYPDADGHGSNTDLARLDRSMGCPRVTRVDMAVCKAIEAHRQRACRRHRQGDPEELMEGRQAVRRQHHP